MRIRKRRRKERKDEAGTDMVALMSVYEPDPIILVGSCIRKVTKVIILYDFGHNMHCYTTLFNAQERADIQ